MGRLFGTDGVRGIANTQLTSKLAHKIGYAATIKLAKDNDKAPTFVVGMDTRISGDMIYAGLVSGIMSAGGNVLNAGIIPTPAVSVLVKEFNADSGIVISASHNPYEYNGIKFFSKTGHKLPDEVEDEIERYIFDKVRDRNIVGDKVGRETKIAYPGDIYIKYLLSKLNIDSLEGLNIVLDLANGATYKVGPEIFKKLGANAVLIANDPNGVNINNKCGSTSVKNLSSKVLETNADFGIAFDGDGDRVIFVDDKGKEFDGDKIMYLLSCYLKDKGKLNKDTLVFTVMSNLGVKKALKAKGINISETGVGDRYVVERMLEEGYNIGGEQSGHVIISDINSTGDGIATALLVCKAAKEYGKNVTELTKDLVIYPQVLVNATVNNDKKNDYDKDDVIVSAIKKIEEKYAGNGRVLIRTSGTEPLVRVMIEGENQDEIKKDATVLAKLIEERLV
ncbi:phosphoglucosamine mutase [Anaerofustis stercorihominis]|uniref:Phosphoglucosamine mutase n=1 Tax=Anaerofustis stercorihominis TaxID=214853 RepID=A0A3E3E1M7_9FIRM|nr:phosphoglucosamine mutase [Anaerofustis stercorihominis]RGD75089.1 phosphoglucosamine mutase [Anaerofustis stercorihominis]